MRIFVLCATKNGLDLVNLINKHIKVSGVIGISKKLAISSELADASEYCRKKKIEYIKLNEYKISNKSRKIFEDLKIELLICISWQRIIPKWLINIPRYGVIGAHGSHDGIINGRGRSPMNWAILLSKKRFYISIFKIDSEEEDNGDIYDTKFFNINAEDNIETIYLKSHFKISEMILKLIEEKYYNKKIKQPKKGEYLPKITDNDGFIDWNRSADKIIAFIRSKTKPYKGAQTKIKNKLLRIYEAKKIVLTKKSILPGKIIHKTYNNKLVVSCNRGQLIITEYELMNKRHKLIEGEIFESINFNDQMGEIISRHKKKYPKKNINKSISKCYE